MLTNHKGTWCIYHPEIFCQEGYCSECELAKDKEINYNGGNMEYLERLAQIRNEKLATLRGICKAKDLKREIAFRWYGIGERWELDTTDKEIIGVN